MAMTWFSAPAPVARRERIFCAGKPDGADSSALRSGGAGRVQLRRSAGSVAQPGLDSRLHAKANQQNRFGVDGDSGQSNGAGARNARGAGEP